jgi:bifunctional DNA-binding transcriptional regulator/antitoxin component of YhaV-PrlF toxin-antitoxin module
MTVPWRPFSEAGLAIGDRVRFTADGPGRVILERIGPADGPP